MGADNLVKNTPNAPKLICPICLPKPKILGFQWKKASLGDCSPCDKTTTYVTIFFKDAHSLVARAASLPRNFVVVLTWKTMILSFFWVNYAWIFSDKKLMSICKICHSLCSLWDRKPFQSCQTLLMDMAPPIISPKYAYSSYPKVSIIGICYS